MDLGQKNFDATWKFRPVDVDSAQHQSVKICRTHAVRSNSRVVFRLSRLRTYWIWTNNELWMKQMLGLTIWMLGLTNRTREVQ